MERSSPEMTLSHSEIEECDVKHRLSTSQEKMSTESFTNKMLLLMEVGLLTQEKESFTIFKVPHRLREVNEKAYEPNVISIGPYHYRKPHLVRMEDFKKRWFKNFVEKPHLGIDQFREAIRPLLEKIRNCYEQPLHLDYKDEENFDEEKIVDMMVYDGCFVVQLIRVGHLRGFRKLGKHVLCYMRYDLLLLENQLPFFVLLMLYGMIEPNPGPEGHLYRLATSALAFFNEGPLNFNPENTRIRHLLHLVHTTFHPSPPRIQPEVAKKEENLQSSPNRMPSATELEDAGIHFSIQNMQNQEQGEKNKFDITFDNATKELKIPTLEVQDSGPTGHFNVLATSALKFFRPSEIRAKVVKKVPCCVPKSTSIKHLLRLVRTIFQTQAVEESSRDSIPSATELEDAGIRLLSVSIPKKQITEQWKECMFGITFDNGTKELKIPTLQVNDLTERLLRNFMAYEQFFPWEVPTYFVDYAVFIDNLINTSKDVELLRKSGIIDNLLGNDEAVTQMFNKLCDFISFDEVGFYYDIASQLNKHCKRKWNIWKAKLKKDYFNTPWSLISFLAALVLLLLTILQTIFSVLSYYHQRQ